MKSIKIKLKQLFISQNGDTDIKQEHINNKGIYVCSSGEGNFGIIGKSDIEAKIIKKNSITVDMFGCVYYRDFDYKLVTHARIFTLEGDYSKNTMLYIAASLKNLKFIYSFNNMCSWKKIQEHEIELPSSDGINPDYEYMESFISGLEQKRISELEQERISELDKYLKTTELKDYVLTKDEFAILNNNVNFKEFNIIDIFKVINTHSILKDDLTFNSGSTPYVTASEGNNSIVSYVFADSSIIDKGNCVLIGGKTMVVTYQEKDFVSNDSHNLALYLKNDKFQTKNVYLYMVCAIYKSLGLKYHWGDSISKKKIQSDIVKLPIDDYGNIDYNYMEKYITTIEKLTIKDVVEYKDKVINITKQISCI